MDQIDEDIAAYLDQIVEEERSADHDGRATVQKRGFRGDSVGGARPDGIWREMTWH